MFIVRYHVLAIQAAAILLTWLNQWINDVYLITLPLTYIAFAVIMIAMWKWADPMWHNWRGLSVADTDNETVKDA